MALMPPERSSITSFAELQAAIVMAPHEMGAAVAVRNLLLEAQYYRYLVANGQMQMNQNQYFIALENLRQLQKDAAAGWWGCLAEWLEGREEGFQFSIETSDQIYNPPVVTEASKAVEKKPPNPFPDIHFTSHQRVGDEIRDSYIEHVHDMFARGFIDAGEHDARLKAMMLVRTKNELDFLIQDLPEVKPEVKTEEKKKEYDLRIPSLLFSVASFVTGFSVFASSGGSDLGGGVFITLLALGTVSAIIFGCRRS